LSRPVGWGARAHGTTRKQRRKTVTGGQKVYTDGASSLPEKLAPTSVHLCAAVTALDRLCVGRPESPSIERRERTQSFRAARTRRLAVRPIHQRICEASSAGLICRTLRVPLKVAPRIRRRTGATNRGLGCHERWRGGCEKRESATLTHTPDGGEANGRELAGRDGAHVWGRQVVS